MEGTPHTPELDESESSAEDSEEDKSEVGASSEDEENEEEYKQGVEEILKSTGKTLKRGKTMAMKEAISTAKKYNIEASAVAEAEKRLDEHKKQQRREEAEKEVEAFFTSPMVRDRATCEKMLKKVIEAECSKSVIEKLQEWRDEIIITRDLEDEEVAEAKEYLKQSCRDFVLKAAKLGGFAVLLLNLDNGKKLPSLLTVDPPLEHLCLRQESRGEAEGRLVPLCALTAAAAADVASVTDSVGFRKLDNGDQECAVALKYEVNRAEEVLCLVEPTPQRRDKLIEALVVLAAICN